MSLAGIREMSTILTPPEERYPVGPSARTATSRSPRHCDARCCATGRPSTSTTGCGPSTRPPRGSVRWYPRPALPSRTARCPRNSWNVRSGVLEPRIRHPGVHHDRRDGPGHLQRQHTDRRTRQHLRAFQLAQAARQGRPQPRRGYAYFLYPPEARLTETAYDRLATIAQNNEFGAGMAVAMKDLEIRGAGNVLGAEQSGHVAGVGFDLYVRLVGEAVEAYRAAADGKTVLAP